MIEMEVLKTPNSIISLENVRRVERREYETKHTSYGKSYVLMHYEISIVYTNDTSEHITCGTGNNAKDLCDTTFQTIYEKLSKD